ncbi:MAG: DUF1611 domain-containing protein, partial [Bacteroidota bacterium]
KKYDIKGLIDDKSVGKDAGEVLDGIHRNIPIFSSIHTALDNLNTKIDYAIIGIATHGGYLPQHLLEVISECLENGISIVNGLHDLISNKQGMMKLAKTNNCQIIDIRTPKTFEELHFWSGKINEVNIPKLAVLGTDCAIGKRTTTKLLEQSFKNRGFKAEMIYTGQTGWLQGGKYGFIFDATPNDFVSGEIEHAIHSCFTEEKPDIIFVEGQSALRNPSGPCGSEFLLSGKMDGVILQHQPNKTFFDDNEKYGVLPEINNEIELIRMYGVETLAISLNTVDLTETEKKELKANYAKKTNLPVILPLEETVEEITALLIQKFQL